jgi:hypothetical protein
MKKAIVGQAVDMTVAGEPRWPPARPNRMNWEEAIVRISAGLLAVTMLFGVTCADFAKAAAVTPTFMAGPRLLTPDMPRFQRFGSELPPCRKAKRHKRRAAVAQGDNPSPCRRID